MSAGPSIHASAVLVGARALLIRGPAGSGKSSLALALVRAAQASLIAFGRLVADDRTLVEAAHGRLLARPAPELAGLLEVRGLGIRRLPHEPVAVVSHVVDLAVTDIHRLPDDSERKVTISGIMLPRVAVIPSADPLALVLAALCTSAWSESSGLTEN
jgi:serine kinase of HPr protein (carbohydrate metabolism regulator)